MKRRDPGWVLPIAIGLGVGFVCEKLLDIGSWGAALLIVIILLIIKKLWHFN